MKPASGPSLALAALMLLASPARADTAPTPSISCQANATLMSRLELLFGMSRRDAPAVSDEEWQSFVDQEVTPRFPDGLTVVQGYGQWRNSRGVIAKENSRVLMIWYEPKADSDERIEAIRKAYRTRFNQESVMRVDSMSCVSF